MFLILQGCSGIWLAQTIPKPPGILDIAIQPQAKPTQARTAIATES